MAETNSFGIPDAGGRAGDGGRQPWDLGGTPGEPGRAARGLGSVKNAVGQAFGKAGEAGERIGHVAEVFRTAPAREAISHAITGVTGRIPRPEFVGEVARRSVSALANREFLGQSLLDLTSGAVVSGGTKTVLQLALGMSGVGTLQVAVLGLAGGAASAGVREFIHQKREFSEAADDTAREELKRRFKESHRMRNAIIRGAVFGAVGGVVGGEIAGAILDRVGMLEVGGVSITGQEAAQPVTQPEAPQAPGEAAPQTPAQPVTQPEAPQAPAQPAMPEPIPPTNVYGHEVSGSAIDDSLKFDGKTWELVGNGTKNIGNLFSVLGEEAVPVDKAALAENLQKATTLWAQGQLTYAAYPEFYDLFHLANGTASEYPGLLNKDTLDVLRNLRIIAK